MPLKSIMAANGRASRAGRVRGESLRYKDNRNARGALIFAGDSPVACMRWLATQNPCGILRTTRTWLRASEALKLDVKPCS